MYKTIQYGVLSEVCALGVLSSNVINVNISRYRHFIRRKCMSITVFQRQNIIQPAKRH